VKKFRII